MRGAIDGFSLRGEPILHELLFAAKQDLETPEPISPAEESVSKLPKAIGKYEAARDVAARRIGDKIGIVFVRRGKAIRVSSDGKTRLVCLASQRYSGPGGSGNYWYGFTPAQKEFLEGSDSAYVALVCGDSGNAYLLTREEVNRWLPEFLTTPPQPESPDDVRHWHIYFYDYGTHVDLIRSGGGVIADLLKHRL